MESKHRDVRYESKFDDVSRKLANISVVENENRREQDISYYPKEVKQVCKDISSYFKADGGVNLSAETVPGPKALRTLLERMSCESFDFEDDESGIWFVEYRLLSPEMIQDRGTFVVKELGKIKMVPFAENIEGELLVTGTCDHSGGVYTYCPESGDVGDEMASSLATYLETYRDELLSNRYEFIEGMGMVERAADAPQTSSSSKK